MPQFNVIKALKKYWYLIVIALLIAIVGAHHVYESDLDPLELLRRFGYPIIIGWTFLEGETIVILAGAFSRRLALRPELIALCAFCGSFISDQLMFSLGKYKGKAVLGYFPSLAKNMDKAAGLLKKYDTALILGFRFVYGVRNVTPILLGISQVSHLKFFILNLIGAAIWAVSFTAGGFYMREAFMGVMHQVGHIAAYVLVGVVVLAAAFVFWRKRVAAIKEKKAARAAEAVEPDTLAERHSTEK